MYDKDKLIESLMHKRDSYRERFTLWRGRLPRFEQVNDILGGVLSESLSELTFRDIEVNPISIDVDLYRNFIRPIGLPTLFAIFQCYPFNHPVVCVFDNKTVSTFVGQSLGCSGDELIEKRIYTPIEREVLGVLVRKVLEATITAWSSVIADFRVPRIRMEVSPFQAGDICPNTPCAIITFEITQSEISSSSQIVVPLPPLEKILPLMQTHENIRVLTCSDSEYVKLIHTPYEVQTPFCENKPFFQNLETASPENLAQFLHKELDSTLACILSFLPKEIASRIMLQFSGERMDRITNRMRKLNIRQPLFPSLIDDYLQTKNFVSPVVVKGTNFTQEGNNESN